MVSAGPSSPAPARRLCAPGGQRRSTAAHPCCEQVLVFAGGLDRDREQRQGLLKERESPEVARRAAGGPLSAQDWLRHQNHPATLSNSAGEPGNFCQGPQQNLYLLA